MQHTHQLQLLRNVIGAQHSVVISAVFRHRLSSSFRRIWAGHYGTVEHKTQSHCWGGKNGSNAPPNHGCSRSPNSCCYNYWWRNDSAQHGVSNLSYVRVVDTVCFAYTCRRLIDLSLINRYPVPTDDAIYIAESFIGLLRKRVAAGNKPFLAQLSYHNNHIPYVATSTAKADCTAGKTCKPVSPSAGNTKEEVSISLTL